MNIGQILEIHLGWACHALGEEIRNGDPDVERRLREAGYDFDKYGMPEPDEAGIHIATPVFDGCRDEDLATTLRVAICRLRPRARSTTAAPVKNWTTRLPSAGSTC